MPTVVSAGEPIVYFREFEFDLARLDLRRAGTPVRVDPVALRMLEVLVRNAGKLVSKAELIAAVWGGRAVADNALTVAMARLRKTLGHTGGEPEFIINSHSRGYRFVCPVSQRPSATGVSKPRAPAPSGVPFVGREGTLRTLHEALLECSAGRGNACVLTGDPGIGKTRAIEVFEREALGSGAFVAWGHCRESGDTPPLWPFAQLVRQLMVWSSHGAGREKLRATVCETLIPELALLSPELANAIQASVGLDAPKPAERGRSRASKHQVFDAITQLFAHAAEQIPCVLVLDDLHRADAASLELLEYWIDQLAHTRVLLLATFTRLELALPSSRAALAYVAGHRNTTRLPLPPLNEVDVAQYLRLVLGDTNGELSRAVFTKSEGNPFFMTELARRREWGHTDPNAVSIPTAALELVRRRLAILDENARGALSCAAVIGRHFELPLLHAVSEQDGSSLMNCLDAALEHAVVVREHDSRSAFRFAHQLLRDALYDALSPAELRRLHLRVAHALEERRFAGADVPIGDLAFQFHAALPASDLRKTVQYCRDAANASSELFAYGDAQRYVRHARQALSLMDKPSVRLQLDLLLREALFARVSADPSFESLVREAIRLATERKAAHHLVYAACMLDLNSGFPALAGAREELEDALAILPPDDVDSRPVVLARLAIMAPLAYDAERSAEQLAHALTLAHSSGVVATQYAVRAARLYRFGGELDQSNASKALHVLEQLQQRHALQLTVPPMLFALHRSIRALQLGDAAAYEAAIERCEAIGSKLRERQLSWYVERARALQHWNVGDRAGAIGRLQALHARGNEVQGSILFRAYDQCVISPDVASLSREQLRAALAQDPADPPNIWSMKLRALTGAGMREEARERLAVLPAERLPNLPRDRDYLGTLGALVHVALELGASAYFAPLQASLGEFPGRFAVHGSFLCEGSTDALRALLARSARE